MAKQGQHGRGANTEHKNIMQEIIRGGNLNINEIFLIDINIHALENSRSKHMRKKLFFVRKKLNIRKKHIEFIIKFFKCSS